MDGRSLIDDALEISVVGSFSRIGFQVRRRVFGWMPPTDGSLAGRTVLVTGPTSGIGRAATDALASLGARVLLVGRSEERLRGVRDDLVAVHGEDRFPIVVADMGSLTSVRSAVARILATEPRLDVVIDNAGAIYPTRTVGPDGTEATLALLVVGPFALIGGLLPLLRRTRGCWVISVISGGQYAQALHLDDLRWDVEPYDGTRAYARAKRAQVTLVREWARRLGGTGVTVNAMHPGWSDTPGIAASLPGFYRVMGPLLRTPAEGADTLVWLAAAAEAAAMSGKLFADRRPRPFDRIPSTRLSARERRRLWDLVVSLSGEPDPAPER